MIDHVEIDTKALAIAVLELADSLELVREVMLRVTPLHYSNARFSLDRIHPAIERAQTLARDVCEAGDGR